MNTTTQYHQCKHNSAAEVMIKGREEVWRSNKESLIPSLTSGDLLIFDPFCTKYSTHLASHRRKKGGKTWRQRGKNFRSRAPLKLDRKLHLEPVTTLSLSPHHPSTHPLMLGITSVSGREHLRYICLRILIVIIICSWYSKLPSDPLYHSKSINSI